MTTPKETIKLAVRRILEMPFHGIEVEPIKNLQLLINTSYEGYKWSNGWVMGYWDDGFFDHNHNYSIPKLSVIGWSYLHPVSADVHYYEALK